MLRPKLSFSTSAGHTPQARRKGEHVMATCPGPAGTSFFDGTSTVIVPRIWTILHRLSEEHWRHLHKRESPPIQGESAFGSHPGFPDCFLEVLSCASPGWKRPIGSPSLMVRCRRRHSCLSTFGVDHIVKPVSVRQTDFKSMRQLPRFLPTASTSTLTLRWGGRPALPLPLFWRPLVIGQNASQV